MNNLSPSQHRALRARAHALQPIVLVGAGGLTEAVMTEVERGLSAHELIKIRAADADRDSREAMLSQICAQTGAAPVQHIGKILVVYREKPAKPTTEQAAPRKTRSAAKKRGPARAKRGAGRNRPRAPAARRPRKGRKAAR